MARKIQVVEGILSANDRLADLNRSRLDNAGIYSLNLMASPGAGKTSLIETTLRQLANHISIAVIDGDIATDIDAKRAANAGAIAYQINTGGECHLDARMIEIALTNMVLDHIDLLLIENVGNLICPASFRLGAHKSVLIASVPEGDDKPYKYPGIYRGVDALVINKIDLLPYIKFDMDYFKTGVQILNPGLVTFEVSCQTNDGIEGWLDWIRQEVGLATGISN
jgi:hydrogenase nickel incorporation protein HypB